MAGFQGMDPAAMRTVAQRLRAQATALDGIVSSVQRSVDEAVGLWDGDDAHGFNNWWASHYRPALAAAHSAVADMASTIERNVTEQEHASGAGSGQWAGVTSAGGSIRDAAEWLGQWGLPVSAASLMLAQRFAPRGPDGRWLSPGSLSLTEREMKAVNPLGKHFLNTGGWGGSALRGSDKSLGGLGLGLSVNDIIEGQRNHDDGQRLTGIIGLGAAIPGPVGIAAGGALFFGEQTIPITNDEIEGSYNRALSAHFGSSYDPKNPTMEQAQWGVERYNGFGGFLNSISDGMDYKFDEASNKVGNAWSGFTGWVSGR